MNEVITGDFRLLHCDLSKNKAFTDIIIIFWGSYTSLVKKIYIFMWQHISLTALREGFILHWQGFTKLDMPRQLVSKSGARQIARTCAWVSLETSLDFWKLSTQTSPYDLKHLPVSQGMQKNEFLYSLAKSLITSWLLYKV